MQVKDGAGGSDGGGEEPLRPGYIWKYSQQALWMWGARGRKESRATLWSLV